MSSLVGEYGMNEVGIVTNVQTSDHNNSGLKVEGDLGDLQIIEDSSEDESESPEVNTLATIPNSLVKASATPVFGSVQVTNSDNVQFGNNTFFNGPVTIKQVIQTNSGVENASYQKTDDETIPNGNHTKNNKTSTKKFQVKTWHKVYFSVAGGIVVASICAIIIVLQNRNDQSTKSYDNDDHTRNEGCEHLLPLVMGKTETSITIWLTLLFMALTHFLWILYLLLTNGNKDTSSTTKDQKHRNDKQPWQYCNKQRADDILIAPGHLRLVSRIDWLAQPVEGEIDAIRQPVPWVIITHTATEDCDSQSTCILQVRLMQMFHIESRKWSDIAYNFLVGGDGSAYYGRGWDQIGAHTKGYNKYAISIAFIGTFNKISPTPSQVDACKKLIRLGVAEGKLAKDYTLLAHRQLMSTLSPGDQVFNIIKTWPHFYTGTNITAIIPNY
ncbi:n-acetylmuramoyl-L-alanine amidase domain-containing protein [Phthorimaea operculella]|nr:n-acetylmuramoyl-L-alanine amidase domain-containing protein [Phthorimaea operculella]